MHKHDNSAIGEGEAVAARNKISLLAKSTSSLVFVQILFRVVTFVTNAVILRHVSSEALGIVNVRLALMYSTSTFIGWEAFRRTLLGTTSMAKLADCSSSGNTAPAAQHWQHAINLSWMCVPVCAAVTGVCACVWLYVLSVPSTSTMAAGYSSAVLVTAAIVCVESTAQPAVIVAQAAGLVKLKFAAEMAVLSCRVLLKCWLIVGGGGGDARALWAYCVSHSTAAVLLLVVYYGGLWWQCRRPQRSGTLSSSLPITSLSQLLPRPTTESQTWFSRQQIGLAVSFFRQGVLKQLLTEGERYVMTWCDVMSLSQQGVYDVVTSLGALAARLVFQPLEDNAYVFFSGAIQRGQPLHEDSCTVLYVLLRALLLFGAAAASLATSYCHLLLWLYGGAALADHVTAAPLLAAHCFYVPLLAVNGVLECFTFAAMTQNHVDGYNRMMVLLSAVFLAAAWGFTRLLGPIGFVAANCVNMATRIIVCYRYVGGLRIASDRCVRPLSALSISSGLLACHLAATAVVTASQSVLYERWSLVHVFMGAACGLALLTTHWRRELRLRRICLAFVSDKRTD